MIDDEHRGYLIELMATKLLSLSNSVQICGMSATLTVRKILYHFRVVPNSGRTSVFSPHG